MALDLKIRKIGNSLGVLLPKEAIARLNASEGDTLVLSETPDGGFRVTPDRNGFGKPMRIFEDISRRYQNALRELAK